MGLKQPRTLAPLGTPSARYKRAWRRQRFFLQALRSISPVTLSDEESFHLLFGSQFEARAALRRARRRIELRHQAPSIPTEMAVSQSRLTSVTRPARILSRLNRSPVFPPVLPEQVAIEAMPVTEILRTLHRDFRDLPPHRLLDALVASSGFTWRTCADLLYACKLIPTPLADPDIEITSRARTFWTAHQRGCGHYAALVAQGAVVDLGEGWGWFDRAQFERLLPGVIVPKRLTRHEYLTRWAGDKDDVVLDVHDASTAAPLFQHPFPNDFNPLFFGKPRNED